MTAQRDQRRVSHRKLSSPSRLLPISALCWLVATALPASAFSQIGSSDGTDRQRDGIVSVPLPPLPGAVEPTRAETPTPEPTATPTSPATAPTGTVAPPTVPAEPGVAPDAGSTDEGESDAPDDATGSPPDATDSAPDENGGTPGAAGGPEEGAAEPSDDSATAGDAARTDTSVAPAPIHYGEDGLPPAVRDLRQKLIEIARAGDIEALRPYLQGGEDATVLTFGGAEGDPITLLKAASGDGEGVEMLAILLEVLQAGHVRSEPDTDDEIFVWPYFTGVPIDKLTNPQKVELFELVTAGDYQEMLGFGAYNFYRVGISPDGKLQFFVAGD